MRLSTRRRPTPRLRALECRLAPATFTVLNLSNSGANSLRDCLSKADAAAGTDTVVFNTGLSGTITLADVLIVSGSVTIDGPGALTIGLTSDGDNAILHDAFQSTPTITIRNLSLFNGVAQKILGFPNTGFGGAILMSDGKLVVESCILTGNSAANDGGAIFAAGATVELRNSIISGNESNVDGGAIFMSGDADLTIDNSTISGNTAAIRGGGICLTNESSKVVITESTISDNLANQGGGIFTSAVTGLELELVNCTISTNSALDSGGGAYLGASNVIPEGQTTNSIFNSTVSGNTAGKAGAGVYVNSTLTDVIVQNSTIANNKNLNPATGGGFHVLTHLSDLTLESCIVTGNSTSFASTLATTPTITMNFSAVDPTGTFAIAGSNNITSGVDLKLGPLANNGGTTKTHLPANDSPVRGKGSNPGMVTTDQRGVGFFRDINGAPDIGAIEVAPQFIVRNTKDSGPDSLRAQIIDANRVEGAQTIGFDPGVFNSSQTITLTSGELAISSPMTITPNVLGVVTINGNLNRIFNTSTAADSTQIDLTNLTLTNGLANEGGAIYIEDESVRLYYCRLIDNSANIAGGAIYLKASSDAAKLTLDVTSLSDNGAPDGGAIYLFNSAQCTIVNSSLTNNTGIDGGAIHSRNLIGGLGLTVSNSTISNNTAQRNGGISLRDSAGTAKIRNSTITQNKATGAGFVAGIGQNGGPGIISLESSIVSDNIGGPDLFSLALLTANFSAVGSTGNAPITGSNNLPLGTDVKLGPIAAGQFVTSFHLPNLDSPVIGTGSNPDALLFDQRMLGFGRARGAVDIGAVEAKTDFVVTNDNNSGAGSLRQAALDADAFFGADNITFSPTFFATAKTIKLTTGEISLGESVNIIGPGSNIVTVSGNNASRIFNTLTKTSQLINLSGLTLTAGNGGAISGFEDTITLTHCVVTGNKSAGAGGGIRLTGAGLYVAALNLINTTVTGNSAATTGGGVYLSGQVSVNIVGSTLSGNTATGRGGAVYFFGGIGTGGFTVRNSTLSGNQSSSGGGAVAFTGSVISTGTASFQNSTITANVAAPVLGGGISQTSGNVTISLESSIVYGNTAGLVPDIAATVKVNAKNSALGGVIGFSINDLGGNLTPGTNPLLGPLANNGGPTQTHALLTGSPAINKGSNPVGLGTDQRGPGYLRNVNGGVDIGAVEVQSPAFPEEIFINDSDPQRSRVTTIVLNFTAPPLLGQDPTTAFQLRRQSDNALVTLAATQQNIFNVTLTFTGGPVEFGSLADGRYTLTILASECPNLDGNNDGAVGDDFTLIGTPANGLYRLFGDADGDGDVDAGDFGAFRAAFSTADTTFDFDADGDVDTSDFGAFRARFGASV